MPNSLRKILASGISPLASQNISGDTANGLTATGSTQTDALAITADSTQLTTVAASTGVILPAASTLGDEIFIYNSGANTLNIYPPVGGAINALSTNTAYTLATVKSVLLVKVSNTLWVTLLSA